MTKRDLIVFLILIKQASLHLGLKRYSINIEALKQ